MNGPTRAVALPGDPPPTPEPVREHGLNDRELERIRSLLGRDPTFTELGIFPAPSRMRLAATAED